MYITTQINEINGQTMSAQLIIGDFLFINKKIQKDTLELEWLRNSIFKILRNSKFGRNYFEFCETSRNFAKIKL